MKIIAVIITALLISCCSNNTYIYDNVCEYNGGQIVEKRALYNEECMFLYVRHKGNIHRIRVVQYDYELYELGDYINCTGNSDINNSELQNVQY